MKTDSAPSALLSPACLIIPAATWLKRYQRKQHPECPLPPRHPLRAAASAAIDLTRWIKTLQPAQTYLVFEVEEPEEEIPAWEDVDGPQFDRYDTHVGPLAHWLTAQGARPVYGAEPTEHFMASLAFANAEKGLRSIVMTTRQSNLVMVGEHTDLLLFGPTPTLWTAERFRAQYGFEASRYDAYLAWVGDKQLGIARLIDEKPVQMLMTNIPNFEDKIYGYAIGKPLDEHLMPFAGYAQQFYENLSFSSRGGVSIRPRSLPLPEQIDESWNAIPPSFFGRLKPYDASEIKR